MPPSLRLGKEVKGKAMEVVVDIIEQTGGLVYLVGQCLRVPQVPLTFEYPSKKVNMH